MLLTLVNKDIPRAYKSPNGLSLVHYRCYLMRLKVSSLSSSKKGVDDVIVVDGAKQQRRRDSSDRVGSKYPTSKPPALMLIPIKWLLRLSYTRKPYLLRFRRRPARSSTVV